MAPNTSMGGGPQPHTQAFSPSAGRCPGPPDGNDGFEQPALDGVQVGQERQAKQGWQHVRGGHAPHCSNHRNHLQS